MASTANQQVLTSTTAPGKVFSSRAEIAQHYKSDWHKYNLKRREAGMAMLSFHDFNARLEAAMAIRKEREGKEERSGKDHLKDKSSDVAGKKKNKAKKQNQKLSKRQQRRQEKNGDDLDLKSQIVEDDDDNNDYTESMEESEEEIPPEIDPCQSLFDKHISPNVKANVDYMYKKYGFFIPDREHLIDVTGLIGYCAEKIKLGHTCLYCQKTFRTWRGCQEHMVNSRHCKLKYERGIDYEEFDVFYDFTSDNEEFLASGIGNHKKRYTINNAKSEEIMEDEDMSEDDNSGEWEDIDSDEDMEDDDGMYAAYQEEIEKHGFDITPLGELIFPDGRIIGHRGLSRYYKQRFRPQNPKESVLAARRSNAEQLYEGRVYDTYALRQRNNIGCESALQLAKAGISIGAAQGRQGRGILVSAAGAGGASYTALSLYRYKAALKKANKEEHKGRRLQQRTTLPMNKMDKKANRLHNNVSVAHALR